MPSEPRSQNFKTELERLTSAFRKNLSHFKSEAYDESALRNDYLIPFWRALGWDVENLKGETQPLREVQIESRVNIAGKKKRADYLFRTDGIERFVCEAKKSTLAGGSLAVQAADADQGQVSHGALWGNSEPVGAGLNHMGGFHISEIKAVITGAQLVQGRGAQGVSPRCHEYLEMLRLISAEAWQIRTTKAQSSRTRA